MKIYLKTNLIKINAEGRQKAHESAKRLLPEIILGTNDLKNY